MMAIDDVDAAPYNGGGATDSSRGIASSVSDNGTPRPIMGETDDGFPPTGPSRRVVRTAGMGQLPPVHDPAMIVWNAPISAIRGAAMGTAGSTKAAI